MWSEKRRCWAGDEGSAGDGGPGRAVVGGGRKKGCVCLQPLAVAGESWLRVKVINVQLITLERKRTHTHTHCRCTTTRTGEHMRQIPGKPIT